jgi:Na+-transporting methylmalonyl-CoA/oxaloacetate decarboxylase gamma subunit
MDTLIFGLSLTAIGLVVVFAGLILLIFFIKVISFFSNARGTGKGTAAADVETDADIVEEALPAVEMEAGVTPEIIAAVTAAVAAIWQGETGFVVRRVRRVNNAAAWNLAGRENQVYSRM